MNQRAASRRWRNGVSIARLSVLYFGLSVLKNIVPVQTLARGMWAPPAGARDPMAEAAAVARVVRLRRVFGRTNDCLESSLLLYRELSRAGAEPRLKIGLHHDGVQRPGHSWVEVAGRVVGDAEDRVNAFVEVVTFEAHGRTAS